MTNIWAFLNQTLTVSTVAGLLFFIKWILKDKLSPRWQYSVWIVLAIRILMPVNIRKAMFLPIPVWVEYGKGLAEQGLNSSFSGIYESASISHIIPIVQGTPVSITDWLFIIYVLGVSISLFWYLISYLRLQKLVKKGAPASEAFYLKMDYIGAKYGLRSCKAVAMPGLRTAFVCGGGKPILVLPSENMDEKIILHELLHLKYHDELQSIVWCVLRSLHWCNPFLQYIFNEIGNEMESLCDQRVLERLHGEERREYGSILLEMANEKYARVPGTSSISNGGKNISKRIAAIVRFKKYPKGMALVSFCITFLLLIPAMFGTDYVIAAERYEPMEQKEWEYALAVSRVNRCTTVAGAVDTYAKGLLSENTIYMASAMPLEMHKQITQDQIEGIKWIREDVHYDNIYHEYGYSIWNLHEVKNGVYEAWIAYDIGMKYDTQGCLLVPVEIYKEDAWVVRERGERRISPNEIRSDFYPSISMEPLKEYYAEGEKGTVTFYIWTEYFVDNALESQNDFFMSDSYFDSSIKLDAEFQQVRMIDYVVQTYCDEQKELKSSFGMIYAGVKHKEDDPEFTKLVVSGSGGGRNGFHESWFSQHISQGSRSEFRMDSTYYESDIKAGEYYIPEAFKVRIFWDGSVVEELTVTEGSCEQEEQMVVSQENQNRHAIRMEEEQKLLFMQEKDQIPLSDEMKLSKEEIDLLLEQLTFASDEDTHVLTQELELSGIYKYEMDIASEIPSYYTSDIMILEPAMYYNANDGSWIVVCAGCYFGDFSKDMMTGDIGIKDNWGIDIVNSEGIYACDSYITRIHGSMADGEGNAKKVTTSLASKSENGGGMFELQDYTYKEVPLLGETQYVGARWYGAITYAPGFEHCSGELVAYYQHTD